MRRSTPISINRAKAAPTPTAFSSLAPSPVIGIQASPASRRRSDGFTPAQQFETGLLSAGTVLGHTFALGTTTTAEPWAGAFFDYRFINDTDTHGAFDDNSYGEQEDVRVQLGLNLNLAANVQLALTGETSGLLLEETDSYSGEANLAVQF
jgi:hypothetical protein